MSSSTSVDRIGFVNDTLVINDKALAQEFAKKVLTGLCKAVRAFVATRENPETEKKEYCDVSIAEGLIAVGTDHSPFAAMIQPILAEFCTKKSELRKYLEQVNETYCTLINYGIVNPWLKLHEKNISYAEIGPNGIKLSLSHSLGELELLPTNESIEYAANVFNTVTNRLGDQISEEVNLQWDSVELAKNKFDDHIRVLKLTNDNQIIISDRLDTTFEGIFQMRFNFKLLPEKDCTVVVYKDTLGGKIVRFDTTLPTLVVNQFFRIIEL